MQAIQLNLLDLPETGDNTPVVFSTASPTLAAKFRKMADKMQPAIDAKKNPKLARQRSTARRARLAGAMYEEGLRHEKIQTMLHTMALEAEAGTLPDILQGITQKAQLEILLDFIQNNWKDFDLESVFVAKEYADRRSRLAKAGIRSKHQALAAIAALQSLQAATVFDTIEVQIKNLERDLISCNIPGYFPTPQAVVRQMVQQAGIYPGLKVLEPSAGKGNIAEAIRVAGVEPDCIEVVESLRQILRVKKFNLVGRDFLECDPNPVYDRILMNAPFEKGKDIQHVRWGYEWLAPSGRLVAIVSNSYSFRREKKYQQFRSWLTSVGADELELPDGAFKMSDRPTSVKTRLLVIDKPMDDAV